MTKRMPTTLTCATCGVMFQRVTRPPHDAPKYCTKTCRNRGRKWEETKRVPCVVCGEPTGWDRPAKNSTGEAMHKTCRYGPGSQQWTCKTCGDTFTRSAADGVPMYCGPVCQGKASQTSDIRISLEAGDMPGVMAAIRDRSSKSPDGCWIWGGKIERAGYAVVNIGRRSVRVHRLSVEASWGMELGSQTVHHKCAVRSCVNPDHLEPITHAGNMGEMLTRRAYVARIRELEDALARFDPNHELLARLPVA